ncbi:MAG: nucleoside deaminase [Rickettsiales bacterium]|nr:nucleoside deaminase [Rickettsiales bacterium]
MAEKTNDFMRAAMKMAVRAAAHDDVPIGAVIVRDGAIIGRGENKVQKKQNPTAHAEMIAIRAACKKIEKKFLDGCDIYVSLEPCAMCATAISFARVRRVIFAADDPKGGGINFGPRIYETDGHLWKPDVIKDSVYSDESSMMLKRFFKNLRAKNLKKSAKKTPKEAVKKRAMAIKKTTKKGKKK